LYRSGNLSTLQLVMGDDAQSMLAQQGLAVSLADRQAEVIRRYTNAQRDVTSARADYSGRMKDLQVLAAQQRTRIKDLKAKVKAVEVQLSRLTTGQRALLTTSRASLRAGLTCGQAGIPTASGAAGKAVEYACSKVGDSYVWAAAGPNTFDCSGLTLRAWEQAGVHLPHSADDQFHRGRRVALADIQPGDLVFYHYSGGFQHLGMYVGNGYAIHAPHTGDVVRLYLISQYVPAAIARL
jgi:cell wall-associated NlpC family hydrolase